MYRSAEAMHIFLKMYDGFTGLGVSVPINLHLRNLVVMDMQYSNLKRLWDNQEVKLPLILETYSLYVDYSFLLILFFL